MNVNNSTVALIPGSFDPITYGHIELVKYALQSYDYVYVAVMINPSKKYLFSMKERVAIANAALREFSRVEVISSEGMLWKLAEDLKATGIVKGYRNEKDLAYEQEMASFNLSHNPNTPTELVPSPDQWETLSSTVVRERIQNGLPLEGYLPQAAINVIEEAISKRTMF